MNTRPNDWSKRSDPIADKPASSPDTAAGGRRRRVFVATRPTAPAVADSAPDTPPAPPAEAVDFPLLTEIVSAEAAAAEPNNDGFDETQIARLAADIAHAIGQRLCDALPGLIEAALKTAGEELRDSIAAATESAAGDYIARHQRQHEAPVDPDHRP